MPQIGFTHKTEPIYDRFNTLRRAYEDASGGGRIYNPDFLTVLMDAFLLVEEIRENDKLIWEIETKQAGLSEPVSLRAYIADVEASERVVIKQIDGSQYLEKMVAHNHNAYLTPHRGEAMIFDSRDQATVFLRKCGHEVGNWIIKPA